MKIGALSTTIMKFDFDQGLEVLAKLQVQAIELGCGGFLPLKYCDPDELLSNKVKRSQWLDAFKRNRLEISALSIHGQPLSPDEVTAREYDRQFRQACKLAEQIGVGRLTLLAGLPAGRPGDQSPCWITTPFPPYNRQIYRWQWEERLIPYWREHGKVAEDHGCRLCFEMHPSDMVFNPASLMKLRNAVGPVIGCNFDPSHLFWQGIDTLEALRSLNDAIYHVHAKDTRVQDHNVRLNGFMDPSPYSELPGRAWTFRTIGYGHGERYWRDFVSTLRLIGYDDVLSIEHEDEYMEAEEGLTKAANFLRSIIIVEPTGPQWWDYGELGAQMTEAEAN
jgi:sugar phosphate isomerase/epimerase